MRPFTTTAPELPDQSLAICARLQRQHWQSGRRPVARVRMELEAGGVSMRGKAPLDVSLLGKVGAHHNGIPSRGLDLLRHVLCCAC